MTFSPHSGQMNGHCHPPLYIHWNTEDIFPILQLQERLQTSTACPGSSAGTTVSLCSLGFWKGATDLSTMFSLPSQPVSLWSLSQGTGNLGGAWPWFPDHRRKPHVLDKPWLAGLLGNVELSLLFPSSLGTEFFGHFLSGLFL